MQIVIILKANQNLKRKCEPEEIAENYVEDLQEILDNLKSNLPSG